MFFSFIFTEKFSTLGKCRQHSGKSASYMPQIEKRMTNSESACPETPHFRFYRFFTEKFAGLLNWKKNLRIVVNNHNFNAKNVSYKEGY